MSESTIWWIVAGALVSVELLTGSFYLLMLALGASAAALGAMLGLALPAQLILAALVGGAAVIGWHHRASGADARREAPGPASGSESLDVGERVLVPHWDADGTALVHYRGSAWKALHHGTHAPASGLHRIRAIDRNQLILERI